MALLTEWTTPTEIGATDPMSATLFNDEILQNILYLFTPNTAIYHSNGDANWTTTSTTPVTIDSDVMKQSLAVETGSVEVWGNLRFTHDNDLSYIYLGVTIDDDYMHGDVPAGVLEIPLVVKRIEVNSEDFTLNFSTVITGLTASVHSFKPMVWTNAGTITWEGDLWNEFGVKEI
jgi:hypothetical protein